MHKLNEIIDSLKGLLEWSDRLGSEETHFLLHQIDKLQDLKTYLKDKKCK